MIDEPFSPRIEIRRRSPWYEKTPRGFSPKKNILHHLNSRLFHTSHLECCEFHKNCRGPTIHKIYTFIYLNLESATDVKIDKNHPHKQNIKCSFHTKHSLRIYTHNQLIQYTIHNNCTHLHRSQARRISVSFFFWNSVKVNESRCDDNDNRFSGCNHAGSSLSIQILTKCAHGQLQNRCN